MTQGFWGLSWLDWGVIAVYFAVTLYMGLRTGKKVKTREDYFLGGRKFGKLIQTFAMFGQATSAENAVSATTAVANGGVAGTAATLIGGLFYMPVLWLTAPWYRRLRVLTMADFFAERYQSRRMGLTYALISAAFFMIASGMGFAAMGKTLTAIMPKPESAYTIQERAEHGRALDLKTLEKRDYATLTPAEQGRLETLRAEKPHMDFPYVPTWAIMVTIAVAVALYVLVGGLEAAFLTDLVQGMLIIVLTVLLIPFAMTAINAQFGGHGFFAPFAAMHRQLPEWYFELWGSPKLLEFNWGWLLAFGIAGVLNTAVQANQLTAIGSAKDEETARLGSTNGVFIKRYCSVIWGLVGLLALVLFGAGITDPDLLWGTATRSLLGPSGIGLVGLMIACLLAALMSTASTLALTTGALLTNNLYKPLAPNKSEAHYVAVGRAFSLLYIIGGLIIAWRFDSVFDIYKYLVLFYCIVAAAFWLGMTWRRANAPAAWASIVTMLLLTVVLPVALPMIPGMRENPRLLKETAPMPVTRTYHATQADIDDRAKEITKWEKASAAGTADGPCPTPLVMGQRFEKTFTIKKKSVFWWQDFKPVGDHKIGFGLLKVELLALDLLGVKLENNSYSVNETISMLVRILVPFAVMFIVGLATKPQDREHLDRFFARLRTPIHPDPALDAAEVERTLVDPTRHATRLLPGTSWEFTRWDRRDWFGVWYCTAGALGVIVLLILVARIGMH
jgi:SSS family solute:Na+ symporter